MTQFNASGYAGDSTSVLEEMEISRVIDGKSIQLYLSNDAEVEIRLLYNISQFMAGNTFGPVENCYPDEGGEVEDLAVIANASMYFIDSNELVCYQIPAGTEITRDLTKTEINAIKEHIWNEQGAMA